MSFKFSLILPDPSTCQWGRSTDSIPFHLKCLGAAFLFPDIWNMVSPFSGLSDSTFLISSSSAFFASQKYAVLCQSASHLLFAGAVQVLGLPFA